MSEIINRKNDHINLCLNNNVQFDKLSSGFDKYIFTHQSFPEIDFSEIDTNINLLGKNLNAPIFVSSMTGGLEKGELINRNLSIACEELSLPMGLGSQRVIFELPESLNSFQIRKYAPNILLFGNLGAVQLNYGFDLDKCNKIIDLVGADALFLHINALQEAIQPEGDRNFSNLISKVGSLSNEFKYPIFIKECGCGISKEMALKFSKTNIYGFDVSGGGGTSWSAIEGFRNNNPIEAIIGETFRNWGISTADSIINVRENSPNKLVFSSGGIRTGIDIAKSIVLGATTVGIAQPLLKSALDSPEAVIEVLKRYITELKITMFCLGVKNIQELKGLLNTDKFLKL